MANSIRTFKVTICAHGTPAIQVEKPTEAERQFLHRAVMTQFTDDPFYGRKQAAKPFLQCDQKDFILVEFWGSPADFVDWLNSDDPVVVKAKQMAVDMTAE